jgi:superfamily II DNA helicase RecQ
MAVIHEFETPCGHRIKVIPVQKKGGVFEGKWQCRISGPRVTSVSGVKCVYTHPKVEDVKIKVAAFLGCAPYLVLQTEQPAQQEHQQQQPDTQEIPNPILYENIRTWRTQQAKAQQLPPYCIFNNNTLNGIVLAEPRTHAELMAVSGIGKNKCARYGAAILDIVHQDQQRRGLV